MKRSALTLRNLFAAALVVTALSFAAVAATLVQLMATSAALDEPSASVGRAYLLAMITLAGGLLAATATLMTVYRTIRRRLADAVVAAERLAAGDLAVRIDVDRVDEIGRLLGAINGVGSGLARIVTQLRIGTATITTTSREIAAGNQDLSQRTEAQASSLRQTASSIDELTITVRQNADNARHASQLAASASEVAVKGGSAVSDVVTTMSAITESSRRIADIIGVIDGIAFQTNILALNAAVEAARAGEQGRGFAVVAGEVRNLAQRSAAAAKEIKSLIEDSVAKVDGAARLVGSAGSTMDEVVTSITRVTDVVAEITAASREQSGGIEQVNQAIAQMDQATQQNAALVEQAAAAAESMKAQAQSLADAVAGFKLAADAAPAPSLVSPPTTVARSRAVEPAGRVTLRAPLTARTKSAERVATVRSQRTGTDGADWNEF